jgi:hypothetical protein
MSDFTIGCDPELFLKSNTTGRPVSAHDILPGNKKTPFVVTGGAVQPDGLAAEFNAGPFPADDFKAFNEGVLGVMRTMHGMVKEVNPDLTFDIIPSTTFDPDYYEGLPEDAKELGCDPDFCAYSNDPFEPNVRPSGATGLRGAGGHIHIGWASDIPVDNPDHIDICRGFIRNLDIFVGLGMTIIDTDDRRREVYGKAGAYRPKSYGVEYRTPSNAWLKSEATRRFIHGLVSAALADMMKGEEAAYLRLKPRTKGKALIDAQSIINTGNAVEAYRVLTDVLGQRVPDAFVSANPKLADMPRAN